MPWSQPANKTTGSTVTAANWNEFATDFRFLAEVAYAEFTSNVSVTATTEAGANTIVTASAFTAEAAPHIIEFYSGRIVAGAAALRIAIFDGSTSLGLIASMDSGQVSHGVDAHRLTPTAASHTYSIRAWNSAAGTSTIGGGTGGTGPTLLPGFIRIYRVPT